jgi:hypothetical protein
MKRKLRTAAFFCVALLFAASVGWAFALQVDTEQEDTLESLLVEYRATLKDRHKHLEIRNQQGTLQYSEFIEAQNEVLAEELLVATSKDERVALLKKRIENLKSLEETVAAQFQAATATSTDSLVAKSKRLLAEIELIREQR